MTIDTTSLIISPEKPATGTLLRLCPPPNEGTKRCGRCGETKLLLEGFSKDKSRRGGRARKCRKCTSSAATSYRAKNRAVVKAREKIYRANNRAVMRAHQKKYRTKNHAAIKARLRALHASPEGERYLIKYSQKYYGNPKNRMRYLVRGAAWRARKKGLPYDSELGLFLTENPPLQCASCNRKLEFTIGRGHKNIEASPSLDRFDPAVGCTLNNVNVICTRCNLLKSNATIDELEQVVAYMKRGWGLRRAACK